MEDEILPNPSSSAILDSAAASALTNVPSNSLVSSREREGSPESPNQEELPWSSGEPSSELPHDEPMREA